MTLQYDPNIRRRQANTQFREGVVQTQAGPFDSVFSTNLQYQHRTQELTEARKQNEIQKRQRLDDVISSNKDSAANAQALIPLLDRLKTSPPGQEPLAQIRAIDPAMADLLQLFDNLIANTTDPAQRQNLINTRLDFINTTLGKDFENSLKDALTQFSDTVAARAKLGDAPLDEVFYSASVQFQYSKLFRSGIQLSPFFDGSTDGTNFKGKPVDPEFGGKGLRDLYTFHAGTSVNFPLLRGRGASYNAAFERAAAVDRDASRLNEQHQASVSALATVQAYWDLRGAQDALVIARRSAELQANLLNLTTQLINAGDLPRAELARAQAGDARARAQVEDAQRQVHQARVALATAIGVAATGDDATLPVARDDFPPVPDAPVVSGASSLVGGAAERRLDLSAATKERDSSRLLQDAATTNLRSLLNLNTSTWFTALRENSPGIALQRWVGPSANLALQYEKPLGNNLFRGQLVSREADVRSRDIAATDLQRQIRLGVLQASSTLPDVVAQARQAEAAVGFYRNIYDADVERYRTGEATLIDTVITQQQQTEAMLALLAARHQLAQLIAQLRYQTGTLLGPNATVAPQNLVSVPPTGRNPQ